MVYRFYTRGNVIVTFRLVSGNEPDQLEKLTFYQSLDKHWQDILKWKISPRGHRMTSKSRSNQIVNICQLVSQLQHIEAAHFHDARRGRQPI